MAYDIFLFKINLKLLFCANFASVRNESWHTYQNGETRDGRSGFAKKVSLINARPSKQKLPLNDGPGKLKLIWTKAYLSRPQRLKNTTLSEIIDRYSKEILPSKKSQRQVLSQFKTINKELGHLSLTALTPSILADFRDSRLKKVKGHTVRKDLLLIRRVLVQAQKEWEIYLPRGNPIDSVSIPTQPKGRDRRLIDDEEEKLLNAAQEYGGEIYNIIILAMETAMRRGEIAKLRWKDINLSKRTALLYDTKNTEDRVIPLTEKAYKLLKDLPRNISGKVFIMQPDSITQAFERIRKQADMEDFRFHDLQHEATSRFFEKGLSIMEVSAITGHKDLAMLRRYTHLRAEDLVSRIG